MANVVSDLLRLQADGWYLVATRGSHRQFKHPVKSGRVTVPCAATLILSGRAKMNVVRPATLLDAVQSLASRAMISLPARWIAS